MKNWITFLIGLNTLLNCFGQSTGQNPGQFDWEFLETPAGNVIYPKGMQEQAERVANIINYQQDCLSVSVGSLSKGINLIIQNQTVVPNAYVALSPFRSELYAIPPENIQAMGSVNWLDGIAIHEFRHVQQFANTRYGLTKIAYYLQGQNGWNVMANLSIPDWYFEGDAVIAETALTNSGRGRRPSFTALQRALSHHNITYKYQKVRNGSFKDYVPSHYATGYMMLSYLRNKKGNEIMVPVIKEASAYKGVVYPFSRALKKHTGFTSSSLYQASWDGASTVWEARIDSVPLTPTVAVTNVNHKTVTNYHFPQFTRSGKIVALKKSFKKTDKIVEIAKEDEHKYASPGQNLGNYFHTSNDKFVWTEYSQNPRHTNISYSDVYVKGIHEKKKKLTKKGNYFSPVLNSDGSVVLVIHITPNQICSFRQIDVKSSLENTILTFDKNVFIARPSFSEKDESIVYICMKENRLAIWKYDFSTHIKTQITPWSAHVIDAPKIRGNYVYYTASFNGIDNIYRSPLDGSLVIEQLTSVRIGAYEPCASLDEKVLLFTEQTEKGRVVSKIEITGIVNEKNVLRQIIEPVNMQWQDEVAFSAEGGNILNKIPNNYYKPKDYKGLFKGLTLHSWSISPSLSVPELVLSFNNYLDDVSASIGVGYNRNENGAFIRGKTEIGKWYPVLTLGALQADRSTEFLDGNGSSQRQTFNETQVSAGISIPLDWIRGNYFSGISPTGLIKHHWLSDRHSPDGDIPSSNNATLTGKTSFYILKRKAYQNIATRFGMSGSFEYSWSLNRSNNEKIKGVMHFFLPGLFANHSLQFSGGAQKELLSNPFQQADDFEYVRGYNAPSNDSFLKFSVDYSLPLGYPDLGVWGITYFKRIRTNLFFDYGVATLNKANRTYQSIGVELIFDNVMLNVIPLSFGIRGSYFLSEIAKDQPKIKPSVFIFVGF